MTLTCNHDECTEATTIISTTSTDAGTREHYTCAAGHEFTVVLAE